MQEIYFSIKNFTYLSQIEMRSGYKRMVDGLWYKKMDEESEYSELDIVVNFPLNFYVNEQELKEYNHLTHSLARLSGEKSNISSLIARLKEKEKLYKNLITEFQEKLEDEILQNEKSSLIQENENTKEKFQQTNKLYSENKTKLKDITERINALYKKMKDCMDVQEYEEKLSHLKSEHTDLLINENQYKIDLDNLKEELSLYSKLIKKPLTNIDLEKKISKNTEYKRLNHNLTNIINVIEYVEQLDNAQMEKSFVIRGIKSVVQNDWSLEKNTIRFSP